jgi:hypothetical protein
MASFVVDQMAGILTTEFLRRGFSPAEPRINRLNATRVPATAGGHFLHTIISIRNRPKPQPAFLRAGVVQPADGRLRVRSRHARRGWRLEVTAFISDPAQDPHSYEANTKNQLALSKAKAVIENGGGSAAYRRFVTARDQILNQSPHLRDC